MQRILIVDDNASNRELLVDLCARVGIPAKDIEQATNGKEAQEKITVDYENPFRLVITDMDMPIMNGGELVNWSARARLKLPVIMVSGYPTLNPTFRIPRTFAFVSKPYKTDFMVGLIALFLSPRDI